VVRAEFGINEQLAIFDECFVFVKLGGMFRIIGIGEVVDDDAEFLTLFVSFGNFLLDEVCSESR
jgi:hypothetical protein